MNLAQSLHVALQVCIASADIKTAGFVGFAYREEPNFEHDSGWRFFSGNEDDDFNHQSENFVLFKLNDFQKLQPEIETLLQLPHTLNQAWLWDDATQRYQVLEEWQNPNAK